MRNKYNHISLWHGGFIRECEKGLSVQNLSDSPLFC